MVVEDGAYKRGAPFGRARAAGFSCLAARLRLHWDAADVAPSVSGSASRYRWPPVRRPGNRVPATSPTSSAAPRAPPTPARRVVPLHLGVRDAKVRLSPRPKYTPVDLVRRRGRPRGLDSRAPPDRLL